eukprot:9026853-Pyramimonas_sp.AAC.1
MSISTLGDMRALYLRINGRLALSTTIQSSCHGQRHIGGDCGRLVLRPDRDRDRDRDPRLRPETETETRD